MGGRLKLATSPNTAYTLRVIALAPWDTLLSPVATSYMLKTLGEKSLIYVMTIFNWKY